MEINVARKKHRENTSVNASDVFLFQASNHVVTGNHRMQPHHITYAIAHHFDCISTLCVYILGHYGCVGLL